MSKAIFVCGLMATCIFSACATGGQHGDEQQDASVAPKDSSTVLPPDARIRMDGGVVNPTPDAQVSQTPDAGSSGPFCATNSDCTVSGECCVTIGGPMGFCAPGTVILGQCFPD